MAYSGGQRRGGLGRWWRGAPVVRGRGGVVVRVRQLEAETLVESSEVGDVGVDRGELG